MIITLSKKTDIKKLEKALKRFEKFSNESGSIDLENYAGKVTFKQDGLEYQKQSRDEWK